MPVHSLNMSREKLFALLGALFFASAICAAEPQEILLWPDGAPGSEGKPDKDIVIVNRNGERSIYGVHQPSITPFLPAREKATGAAVLVIPGGGHRVLAPPAEKQGR